MLFSHFHTASFINDNEIRFIDKTDPSDPTRREDFWMDTLKTRYPLGFHDTDPSQPAFTWSKLTIETLEQGVKYVQS